MKLYHYAPLENTCLEKGILSVFLLPECLFHYAQKAGSEDCATIIKWLDNTFEGRSRSVSCFTEPLKLNGEIVLNGGHLFSFDIDELVKDELVESIYQKTRSGNGGNKEAFQKIEPQAINYTPLDFSKYTTEYELTHAFFRHYMIVLKDGTKKRVIFQIFGKRQQPYLRYIILFRNVMIKNHLPLFQITPYTFLTFDKFWMSYHSSNRKWNHLQQFFHFPLKVFYRP